MTKQYISEEQFHNHDCHASPEDGCETCAQWEEQQETKEREIAKNMKALEEGRLEDMTSCPLCGGKGITVEPARQAYSPDRGTYIEDEREVECPHVTLERNRRKEQDEEDNWDKSGDR